MPYSASHPPSHHASQPASPPVDYSSASMAFAVIFTLCLGALLGFFVGYRFVVWRLDRHPDAASAGTSTISSYDGQSMLRTALAAAKQKTATNHSSVHLTPPSSSLDGDHQLESQSNIYASPPYKSSTSSGSRRSTGAVDTAQSPAIIRPPMPPPPPPHMQHVQHPYASMTLARNNPATRSMHQQQQPLLMTSSMIAPGSTLPRNHRVKQVYL